MAKKDIVAEGKEGIHKMVYSSAIKCDKCGAMRLSLVANKTLFKKIARSDGWSFGKQDLCPDCKRRKYT